MSTPKSIRVRVDDLGLNRIVGDVIHIGRGQHHTIERAMGCDLGLMGLADDGR